MLGSHPGSSSLPGLFKGIEINLEGLLGPQWPSPAGDNPPDFEFLEGFHLPEFLFLPCHRDLADKAITQLY